VNVAPVGLVRRLAEAPRWLVGLAIVALFLIDPLGDALRRSSRTPLFAKLEAMAYDARLKATQGEGLDPTVVIIDIDEKSIQREGRWQWSRDRLARLVDMLLKKYKARAVGFDVMFPERNISDGIGVLDELARVIPPQMRTPSLEEMNALTRRRLDYDARFADALNGSPTVLAFTFTVDQQAVGALPAPAFVAADVGGHVIEIRPEQGYTANLAELQRAAAGGGHIDPAFDSDQVVRRVPLVKLYGGDYYPALSLAVAQVVVEAKTIRPRFDVNGDIDALDVGGLIVPVARDGTALVPYRGAKGTFKYHSATDILAGTIPEDAFAGAVALVGTTAKGLEDLRTTPVAPDFPGVEIHANLLSGMLGGDLKSIPPGATEVEAVMMLVAGLLVVFAIPWRRPLLSVIGILAVATLVVAVNMWFWTRANAVIPLAATLVMLLVLLVWHLLGGFLRESRAIRQLSDLFGEYVPPERVKQMRETGERFSMEGESRDLTVLFSDVRDFTSASESLAPLELSALMNAYLTPMTETIHARRGTIDKYIGDAIMAFWGAPLPNEHHARDAVEAALEMQQRMTPLREQFRARGWPELAIGIGVNTGPMNVGDMGSRFRKAYTVLGDAVNLASRLEGLTKAYGVGILCGDDTRRAAPDFTWREIDRVRVKGRAQALSIWEPLGREIDEEKAAELARWNEALALYRARNFTMAGKILASLPERPLHRNLRDRCTAYLVAPPPADWDGATNFATK